MTMIRNIILFFVIIIIYYIYDRNIIILDKLNFDNLNNFIQYIFSYLDKLFNYQETFNNYTTQKPSFNIILDNDTHSKLPEINCLSSLFNKLYDSSIKYNQQTLEFSQGIRVRLEYYFKDIQKQCTAVYNDDKPHLQMSYLLDIQHKILKIIHDFIFITPGSDLPNDLMKLEKDFKDCFSKINTKLTHFNNKKFTYYNGKKENEINTNSGFIEYPNEPLPKNTYYDNFNFY